VGGCYKEVVLNSISPRNLPRVTDTWTRSETANSDLTALSDCRRELNDMANVFSNLGVDLTNLNLNRLQIGAVNFNYLDNAFVAVNGIVYADLYEVVWGDNGNFFSSIFAGPNLIQNPSTGAISGTVTGYVESIWKGALINRSWAWRTSIFPLLRYGTHR
jgi:hypothetical protein